MSSRPPLKKLIQTQRATAVAKKLSTGKKMLLILGLALLPLGLIAVFASREAAHVNRLRHESEAHAVATASAAEFTEVLRPRTMAFRRTIDRLVLTESGKSIDRNVCEARLAALQQSSGLISGVALLNPAGRIVCRTPQYSRIVGYFPSDETGFEVRLAAKPELIRATIADTRGDYFGIVEFPADRLAEFIHRADRPDLGFVLRQGSQAITLSVEHSDNPLDQIIQVAAPVAGGQLSLELRMPAAPISALEILLILLPILMWASGALIGWIIVDRLLLRPLGQMRQAIISFTSGNGPLSIPKLTTPAHEINELGESFLKATNTLTRHEEELAEGLAKQKRLTREVHHRVKNNLQVVSSLISLHARGAVSDAVSEAYASIQRRVDALAVVHRNHYAELEENHGVSLRALISEIASNLRASGGPRAGHLSITLNIASVSASQDVAVPVAFLITELVELVMFCGPNTHMVIHLVQLSEKPTHATLSIAAPALASDVCLNGDAVEKFRRIAEGLARQLRSPLNHDVISGRYSIDINILP